MPSLFIICCTIYEWDLSVKSYTDRSNPCGEQTKKHKQSMKNITWQSATWPTQLQGIKNKRARPWGRYCHFHLHQAMQKYLSSPQPRWTFSTRCLTDFGQRRNGVNGQGPPGECDRPAHLPPRSLPHWSLVSGQLRNPTKEHRSGGMFTSQMPALKKHRRR